MRLSVAYRIPVRELQQRITSAEFIELLAFSMIEPFGDRVADHRASVIAATVANASSFSSKQFTPADFPIIAEPRPKQPKPPLIDRWKAFVARHNEGVKNGRNRKSSR